MCYHGQHIWILYTSGYIAVFDLENHKIIQNIELQELSNDPVTTLVVDPDTCLIAAAYTNGLIAYLWDRNNPSDSDVPIAYFYSSNTVSYQNIKLTTVESCSDVDGHCQIWCGYNIGVIQIVSPPDKASSETKIVKVLQINDYSTDLTPDTYITQLKFSRKKSSLMYALHDGGLAISCWSATTNPKLYSVIKPSVTTPGKMQLISNFIA